MSGFYSPRIACEDITIPKREASEESVEATLPTDNWIDFSFNNFNGRSHPASSSNSDPRVNSGDTPFDEPHARPTSTRSAPLPVQRTSSSYHNPAIEAIYDPPETPQKRRVSPAEASFGSSKTREVPSKQKSKLAGAVPPPSQAFEPFVVYHQGPTPKIHEALTPTGISCLTSPAFSTKTETFLEEGIQFSWDRTEPSQYHDSNEYDDGEQVYGKHYFFGCCCASIYKKCCWLLIILLWVAIVLFLGLLIGTVIRDESVTIENIFSTGSHSAADVSAPPTAAPFSTKPPLVVPTFAPVLVTKAPTEGTTIPPSMSPIPAPTDQPVPAPSDSPVAAPIGLPLVNPTISPVFAPVELPLVNPTTSPVTAPFGLPLADPTPAPVATLNPTKSPTFLGPPPSNITVGAYYYPWHGSNFHGGKYLREKLEPRQSPYLGEYDDTDPNVIAQHLAWSRQANIGLWITSWWGPNRLEDDTTKNVILPHRDIGDHKIALHYETTGRIREDENYTTHRVEEDISYICETYFDHPNYYRIDGRPVLVVYLTRKLEITGVMEEVVTKMRASAQLHGYDLYLIGDHVWQGAPTSDDLYLPFVYLDAVTNYDVFGSMGRTGYATQEIVDKYYGEQSQWREQAANKSCGFIPAVSPGFNDRAVRLNVNHNPLARKLSWNDVPGSLFKASLDMAKYLVDESVDSLLIVNSFNEWHEDTQIEPTVGETTNFPYNYTRGLEYGGYGTLYLDILREATVHHPDALNSSPKDTANPETVVAGDPETVPDDPETVVTELPDRFNL